MLTNYLQIWSDVASQSKREHVPYKVRTNMKGQIPKEEIGSEILRSFF